MALDLLTNSLNAKKLRIFIHMCGDSMFMHTYESLWNLTTYIEKLGHEVVFMNSKGAYLHSMRSKMWGAPENPIMDIPKKDFQPYENRPEFQNYDYVLSIDNDMVFTVSDFLSLYKRDVDIVSGVYVTGNCHTMIHSLFHPENRELGMPTEEAPTGNELLEVFACGMGFTLIRKGVVENMHNSGYWFGPTLFMDKDGNLIGTSGEDHGFCHNAKKAGFKIYVDPTVYLGHYKRMVFYPDTLKIESGNGEDGILKAQKKLKSSINSMKQSILSKEQLEWIRSGSLEEPEGSGMKGMTAESFKRADKLREEYHKEALEREKAFEKAEKNKS